jgi:hypothetical protein
LDGNDDTAEFVLGVLSIAIGIQSVEKGGVSLVVADVQLS